LGDLLNSGQVLMHPFVAGEIALGNLEPRASVLGALVRLPMARVASDEEVLAFIESEQLFGTGVGLIDVHLLASARIEAVTLWTRDKRLYRQADRLGMSVD
jgi:predicted nucleic acid-binding protein